MSAARARTGRGLRRATAVAAAVAILFALLAPLAAAFEDDGTPLCCRGRCCCRAPSRDGDCVSAACHCTGERRALEPATPLPEAVLAAAVVLLAPPSGGGEPHPSADAPRGRALAVPHPPPRSLSIPSIAV